MLLVACLTGQLTGCVLSTYAPPGTSPEVPEPPRPQVEAAAVPEGPATISARHVLVSFAGARSAAAYVTRTREEAFERASEVRERALAGEDFAELAREYSEDRGSAQAGGDLGEFSRAQMVKPFSDAAFALEPGGISPVIESEYGFHVIQRTE
jgi:parvulin-like peptidyl-prolyl isomerase